MHPNGLGACFSSIFSYLCQFCRLWTKMHSTTLQQLYATSRSPPLPLIEALTLLVPPRLPSPVLPAAIPPLPADVPLLASRYTLPGNGGSCSAAFEMVGAAWIGLLDNAAGSQHVWCLPTARFPRRLANSHGNPFNAVCKPTLSNTDAEILKQYVVPVAKPAMFSSARLRMCYEHLRADAVSMQIWNFKNLHLLAVQGLWKLAKTCGRYEANYKFTTRGVVLAGILLGKRFTPHVQLGQIRRIRERNKGWKQFTVNVPVLHTLCDFFLRPFCLPLHHLVAGNTA
ncbi:hypothetical protein B0H13DRAFT_1886570 [Mycena leptocephala]|nr:hypothetical protein B0H13DRAFT_1886570 [Mycena leptocephala]